MFATLPEWLRRHLQGKIKSFDEAKLIYTYMFIYKSFIYFLFCQMSFAILVLLYQQQSLERC